MEINLLKNNLIFILIIIFILSFQNGSSLIFNGLPWHGKLETFFIIFIPFIFFLKTNFIKNNFIKLLLITILITKFFLIFSPQNGIGHKIFFYTENNEEINYQNIENSFFIKTYNSLWNKNFTKIQENNWDTKDNFPLDWINYDHNFNNINGETAKININYEKLQLTNKILFYIFNNKERRINFNLLGDSKNSNINIYKFDFNLNKYVLIENLTNDIKEKKLNKGINLIKGYLKVEAEINFKGKDWKFSPILVSDNKSIYLLNTNICFTEDIHNYSKNFLIFYKYLGNFYNYSLIILFALIFLLGFTNFKNKKSNKIFIFSITISIFYLFTIYLKYKLIWISFIGLIWPISIVFLILILILIFDFYRHKKLCNYLSKDEDLINNYILLLLPSFIIFVFYKYGYFLEKTYFWTHGDDWTVFQGYARKIFIDGEWLVAGEQIFYFRPGARYIYGLIHYLFGEPVFAQIAIEITLIFFISIIVVYYLKNEKVSNHLALIGGLTLLLFYFGENFRWLLGRGLSEYYLTFFIIFAFITIKLFSSKFHILAISCLLGIIAAWLREDKLLTILSLIFICNTSVNENNFINYIFSFIKTNFKKIIFYFSIVLFGFPFLFEIRNYYVGGGFTITSHPNAFVFNYISLYRFLFATPWDTIPRLTPLFLFIPFLLCISTLIFRSLFKFIHQPGLTIIILTSAIPAVFLEMAGYVPRYSISLLPFGIMYMFIFFDKLIKYKKIK